MIPSINRALVGSAALAIATLSAMPVFAQVNVGEIATGLTSQATSVSTLIEVLSFVIGIAMAIMGFMKLKAHSSNPNDPNNKLSTGFMLLFVGAGLVALPATLGSGISTIFGDGASTTDGIDGFGNSIQ